METSKQSNSDSRGNGGRGSVSDRGGGGRNPRGRGRERSSVQAFTGSTGMVKPEPYCALRVSFPAANHFDHTMFILRKLLLGYEIHVFPEQG